MKIAEKNKKKGLPDKFSEEGLRGKYVIVGLSGGADSMGLLHYLASNRGRLSIELEAVHLNHCLRGEESDRDERAAQNFCQKLGVSFIVCRVNIAKRARALHQSEEVCGREERYALFLRRARKAVEDGKEPVIVTAHTLSDDLETTLLHLVRGCTLDGLCGIPQQRKLEEIELRRPLLSVTREEIEQYCAENGLSFVTDSTNFSERYTRNFLRLQVLPRLRMLNPSLEETYARMRESLIIDRAYLDEERDALLQKARTGDGNVWEKDVISAAPEAMRRRVLAAILRESGAVVDAHGVLALERVLAGESRSLTLSGVRFSVRGGRLCSEEMVCFSAEPVLIPSGGNGKITVRFLGKNEKGEPIGEILREIYFTVVSKDKYVKTYEKFFHASSSDKDKDKRKVYKKLLYFAADYDTIMNNAVLRARGPGDEILLTGGSRTLKKLYQQAHLSRRDRELRLVLAQERNVIWAEGIGTDVRFLPASGTKWVLLAAKERMEPENEP